MMNTEELAKMIDHTLLHPHATADQLDTLVDEAKRYGFGAVCVNPYWVSHVAAKIGNEDIGIACVVGFPLGQSKSSIKAAEARQAVEDGATGIDMVINIGALKSQRFDHVEEEIAEVCDIGAPVKAIIEACYLFPEEKVMACELAKRAGAAYVKTSTGFGSYGATEDDVRLMRRVVGHSMGVKAAGGISSWKQAEAMIASGASRIGASKSVLIIEGLKAQTSDE
jgi:deoxyribose-phosphate aldolase